MTVQALVDTGIFGVVNLGDGLDREITKLFCCDLLSIAMSRAPAGCAGCGCADRGGLWDPGSGGAA